MQSSAIIHNTPGASKCVNTVTTKLTNLIFPHRSKVIQCVESSSNRNDANKCCTSVDNTAMLEGLSITNNALNCIMASSKILLFFYSILYENVSISDYIVCK